MYTHASSFFQVMPEFSFHICQRGPFHQEQRDAEAQKREYADSRPGGEIRLVGKTDGTVDGSEIWRENHWRCKKKPIDNGISYLFTDAGFLNHQPCIVEI